MYATLDTKVYLQDLSTMGNVIATSSRASPVEGSSSFVQLHRSNSLPIIPRKRHAPSYPPHSSPVLSASVRSPAMSYRAAPAEESDGWESPKTNKDEESDASEFQLGRQQKRRSRIESRAGSETPSVVSLAGAMSISEDPLHHHRQHQPHHHSRHSSLHKRHHTENTSRALHRDRQHTSEREYESGHEIPRPRTRHQTERSIDAQSIYPRSTSRHGSFSESEDRLLSGQALLTTNGYDPSTSGRSSPYSPFDTREGATSRPPSQSSVSVPSTVDNERFNKLQQELAAIKEQVMIQVAILSLTMATSSLISNCLFILVGVISISTEGRYAKGAESWITPSTSTSAFIFITQHSWTDFGQKMVYSTE